MLQMWLKQSSSRSVLMPYVCFVVVFVSSCTFSGLYVCVAICTVIRQSGGLLTQASPPGDQTFCSVWNPSVTIHFLHGTTLLLFKTKHRTFFLDEMKRLWTYSDLKREMTAYPSTKSCVQPANPDC